MRYKLLEQDAGRRKFMLVLDAGEEVAEAVKAFAVRMGLTGSTLSGIGAFERAVIGHFNPVTKVFRQNEVTEQAELVAMVGNIAADEEGQPKAHIHVVLGLADASTRGGHLVSAIVRPTLELEISESPVHLQRGLDRGTGLVLLEPNG